MSSPLGLHSFLGGVAAGSLSALVNNSVTTFPINTIVVANWPPLATGPFKIVIDQGLSTEESCLVTAATTTSFTVTRAYDGSTAYAHANGATFYTAPEAEAMQDVAHHVYDTTRNDHTQYMLSADLVSGYGLSVMPTPAVDLAIVSGDGAATATLTASATTYPIVTGSLAVGTWVVSITMEITLPAATGTLTFTLVEDSAVCTFLGGNGAVIQVPTGLAGVVTEVVFQTIAVVTTAGTLEVKCVNTSADNGGCANSTVTGYTAIRLL